MSGPNPFELARLAADQLCTFVGVARHDVAVVLGSGWAEAADHIGAVTAEVELSQLSGFPAPRVAGHRNLARSVEVSGCNVLILGGRVHLYEGFSPVQVVHGVRTAQAAGCRHLILTNAAGAVNADFPVGTPVLLSDQINLTGTSPMVGPAPPPELPGRFCDMTNAFDPALRALARGVDGSLREGVYAGMFGGAYETPAEVRMIGRLGADLVGMSTVLETIAARHLDMNVLGISLVTNMAAGISDERLDHEDVLRTASEAKTRIVDLISGVVDQLEHRAPH